MKTSGRELQETTIAVDFPEKENEITVERTINFDKHLQTQILPVLSDLKYLIEKHSNGYMKYNGVFYNSSHFYNNSIADEH